jgi:ESF2/ABP1 family protein
MFILELEKLEKQLQEIRGNATLQIDEEFLKDKEQRLEDAKNFRDKQHKKGVVYLPSLPPFMNPTTVRNLLEKFDVERIYLSPEPEHKRRIRIKQGGNRKIKYTEGWVEFADKKTAKKVADALNGQLIGGKKRHNMYR